jgi:hypothetical protein
MTTIAVRDLVRYRAKVAQQRVSEIARLGDVRQDAGIKIDSVASSVATRSGRDMIEALIDGERRGAVLAEPTKGKMRRKIPDLSMALEGDPADRAHRNGHRPLEWLCADRRGAPGSHVGHLAGQAAVELGRRGVAEDGVVTPGGEQLALPLREPSAGRSGYPA